MGPTVRGAVAATVLLAATLSVSAGQAAADPRCGWQPSLLALPPGTAAGSVEAADGDGWLAGHVADDNQSDPLQGGLWRNGQLVAIGHAFGQLTNVWGVSPDGMVVGSATDPSGGLDAVRYRLGAWERLPSAGVDTIAFDVNRAGDIVGRDSTDGLMVWPAGDLGAPRVLPLPAGFQPQGEPRIDDDGTVAVWGNRAGGGVDSYLWRPGATAPIQLAAATPGDDVFVMDIRNGHVVGDSYSGGGPGVEWNTSGRIVRTIPGQVKAVSSTGFVIAKSTQDGTAFGYGPDGVSEPLPTPAGFTDSLPNAIGDERIGGGAWGPGSGKPVEWQRVC